jgi:hypothetical protein
MCYNRFMEKGTIMNNYKELLWPCIECGQQLTTEEFAFGHDCEEDSQEEDEDDCEGCAYEGTTCTLCEIFGPRVANQQ